MPLPGFRLKGIARSGDQRMEPQFISNWQTGFPFTSFAGGDNSITAMGNDRPDITVANIKDTQLGTSRSHAELINEWFNTDDFVPNAIGTYGNIGKNSLRGPRLFTYGFGSLENWKSRRTRPMNSVRNSITHSTMSTLATLMPDFRTAILGKSALPVILESSRWR